MLFKIFGSSHSEVVHAEDNFSRVACSAHFDTLIVCRFSSAISLVAEAYWAFPGHKQANSPQYIYLTHNGREGAPPIIIRTRAYADSET